MVPGINFQLIYSTFDYSKGKIYCSCSANETQEPGYFLFCGKHHQACRKLSPEYKIVWKFFTVDDHVGEEGEPPVRQSLYVYLLQVCWPTVVGSATGSTHRFAVLLWATASLCNPAISAASELTTSHAAVGGVMPQIIKHFWETQMIKLLWYITTKLGRPSF